MWLFGLRVDDAKRGGDTGLLIETPLVIRQKVLLPCHLEGGLVMCLGDRKFSPLLKEANTPNALIFALILRMGSAERIKALL